MGLSPDAKERLAVVFEIAKTALHWGFIPAVLYLGKSVGAWAHITSIFCHLPQLIFFRLDFIGFKKGPEMGQPPLSVLR